ncbi:MAG: hypothetical protein ACM3Q2_10360 [Syntrophothermus sp.]
MKTTFDTDAILFKVLKGSPEVVAAISGGIYPGERPDNSLLEDIAINTVTLTLDSVPQMGTSNVNIHVPDMDVQISGQVQKKANTMRLKAITGPVLNALSAAKVDGLSFQVVLQSTLSEPAIHQHYVNLRIEWNIH